MRYLALFTFCFGLNMCAPSSTVDIEQLRPKVNIDVHLIKESRRFDDAKFRPETLSSSDLLELSGSGYQLLVLDESGKLCSYNQIKTDKLNVAYALAPAIIKKSSHDIPLGRPVIYRYAACTKSDFAQCFKLKPSCKSSIFQSGSIFKVANFDARAISGDQFYEQITPLQQELLENFKKGNLHSSIDNQYCAIELVRNGFQVFAREDRESPKSYPAWNFTRHMSGQYPDMDWTKFQYAELRTKSDRHAQPVYIMTKLVDPKKFWEDFDLAFLWGSHMGSRFRWHEF